MTPIELAEIKRIAEWRCDCGQELVAPYEALTGECRKCEDARERETALMIQCDPIMRGNI